MNPFGKGIAFPPRVGPTGRIAWSEGERNVEESIAIILRTDPDERVALPRFGTGLTAYLFEPNNAATHARLAHLIETALRKWEPRIAVESVEVAASPEHSETAVAEIAYKLVASGAGATLLVNVPLAAG